ncbi:1841_t:CDS:2, partial [Acaulospora morrowiae]
GNHVMVFDWAEYGTLKQVYERQEIDWNKKLIIARDICSGLVYLNACQILHHDIRCESILVVDTAGSLDAKIANFDLSRETNAQSREIKSLAELLPWLAPEKMQNKRNTYDVKCETYSFGMLLWELCHRRIPYAAWKGDTDRIQRHVLSGNREEINFGLCTGIKSCFKKIILKAWKDNPMTRPLLQDILYDLQTLCERYSPTLPPQRLNDEELFESQMNIKEDLDNLEEEEFDIDEIEPIISLEEGLRAHQYKKHDIAWKCFDANAKLGNSRAKYWQGYYYHEGYHVKEDKRKAMELFKEAADEGVHEAQLRYASTLIKLDPTATKEFLEYLTRSAVNGNSTARFNLGNVYYQGKFDIPVDKKKGLTYLRLAAANDHKKALKMLRDNGEDINE